MKRLVLFTIFCKMILSCSFEDSITLNLDECNHLTTIHQTSSSVIPPEEAISELKFILTELHPNTKGGNFPFEENDILVFGNTATKSSNINIPDSTLYIVNFENDGFAVLSAQRDFNFPVFCITESGTLSIENLEDAFNQLISETTSTTQPTNEVVNPEDNNNFVSLLLVASALNQLGLQVTNNGPDLDTLTDWPDDGGFPPPIGNEGPLPSLRRETISKIGPLIETKWHQYSPFNNFRSDGAPAGCVAVATSQILTHNEINSSSRIFNWDLLKSVHHYTNPTNPGSQAAQSHASSFLKFVGNSDNCNINYGIPTSGGYASGAKRTFENFGYRNVIKYFGFENADKNRVISMISSGFPTYMDGSEPLFEGGGHAWIIDGIYVYRTVNALNDEVLSITNLFHINWGWNGANDGYFEQGVFNTTQRESYEVDFDSGNTRDDSYNYTWNYRTITYSLY